MKRLKAILFFCVLFVFSLEVVYVQATCTINTPAVASTDSSLISSSGKNLPDYIFSVTCGVGETWEATYEASANRTSLIGSKTIYEYWYKDVARTTSLTTSAKSITTGTGTGAAQNVAVYPKLYGSSGCTWNSSTQMYICPAGGYSGSTAFGVTTGGVTVKSSSTHTETLENICEISNTPSLTMSYTGLKDVTDSSFGISVLCNSGMQYTITYGAGNNSSGNLRRQADGTGHYLSYRLYSDSGRTTEIGATSGNTVTDTGTGSAKTASAYAAIRLADEPPNTPTGTYTDTIRVTVDY